MSAKASNLPEVTGSAAEAAPVVGRAGCHGTCHCWRGCWGCRALNGASSSGARALHARWSWAEFSCWTETNVGGNIRPMPTARPCKPGKASPWNAQELGSWALARAVNVAPAAFETFQGPWSAQWIVLSGSRPIAGLQHLAPKEAGAGARCSRPEDADLVCWSSACIATPC